MCNGECMGLPVAPWVFIIFFFVAEQIRCKWGGKGIVWGQQLVDGQGIGRRGSMGRRFGG